MGVILLISLGCTLVASLVFIPALLAAVPRPRRLPHPDPHPRASGEGRASADNVTQSATRPPPFR
jgi:hypothetical protein